MVANLMNLSSLQCPVLVLNVRRFSLRKLQNTLRPVIMCDSSLYRTFFFKNMHRPPFLVPMRHGE